MEMKDGVTVQGVEQRCQSSTKRLAMGWEANLIPMTVNCSDPENWDQKLQSRTHKRYKH